jgi:catechol 2,3-dioxygenase-like lactoylglutathione lyase family enzyme
MIHHVQISCPAGSEERLRAFYIGVLGLSEKPKPTPLAARGGCWFYGPQSAAPGGIGGSELHLGVEEDFRPARKAHPGLLWPSLEALEELAGRLTEAGYPVTWSDELTLLEPPLRRFHTEDPHGNRLEFLAAA